MFRTTADINDLVFVSSFFAQTHKRFKISEERLQEHMSTLGFLQQPGVEGLGEAGEDPYDFKEGDIEYSFPTSKRLKSRDPSRKSKVRRVCLWVLGKDKVYNVDNKNRKINVYPKKVQY